MRHRGVMQVKSLTWEKRMTTTRPLSALVGVVSAAALTACSATSSTSAAASPSPTPTTTPSPSTTASGKRAVAVYYLADTTNGPRLYVETHPHAASSAVIKQAVEAMLHDKVLDPDYTNVWPATTKLLGVSTANRVATIDVSGAVKAASVGAQFEEFALQQLVYTVRAATNGAVTGVRLRVDGKAVESLWGHVDTSGTITAGRPETTLAPVQISSPADGASVPTTFTVRGRATVFEATVSWQLLTGDTVVRKGFSTATTGAPGRGDWSFAVTLPKGSYTVKAFESSAKDGSETFIDTKAVTVG
ncbi:MAG: hypothetical protein JWM93_2270 [Frankiales bacterium]|nr:hypothetical protein [Frankiales bacterium]